MARRHGYTLPRAENRDEHSTVEEGVRYSWQFFEAGNVDAEIVTTIEIADKDAIVAELKKADDEERAEKERVKAAKRVIAAKEREKREAAKRAKLKAEREEQERFMRRCPKPGRVERGILGEIASEEYLSGTINMVLGRF